MTPQKKAPRLFERQKLLLSLLSALGGRQGKRDFQKLLFLYCQELGEKPPYEFVPYLYGAFSFTSYADRRKLIERGLLADDDDAWALTESGQALVGLTTDMELSAFVDRHSELRGDELVAETYRRFPFYATRSEIASDVLKGERAALRRIQEARPHPRREALCTIGYEGHSLESYLNALTRAGVTVLCDVRRNPISRKYGFSKGALSMGCEGVGIRYEHLPELGISSDKRRHLDSPEDYRALFAEYEATELIAQPDALAKIAGWVNGGGCVALTCYEHLPESCHRHCVADALTSQFGIEREPVHL